MYASKAQPKAEIAMRVYRASEGKWYDLKPIKLSRKMANAFARLLGRKEAK